MEIYQLVYISKSARLLTNLQLVELLTLARKRNAKLQVTGLLLYKDKSFIQLLEGPKASIEKIFAGIKKDKRHFRIRVLVDYKKIENQLFPDWAMGFERLDASFELEGYKDIFKQGFEFSSLSVNDEENTAMKLLMHFRRAS